MAEENKTIHLDDLINPSSNTDIAEEVKEPVTVEEVQDDEIVREPEHEEKKRILRPGDTDTDLNTAKASQIGDIRKYTEKVDPDKEFWEYEMDLIDKNIERTKEDLKKNVLDPVKERCIEIAEEKELESMMTPEEKGKDDSLDNVDESVIAPSAETMDHSAQRATVQTDDIDEDDFLKDTSDNDISLDDVDELTEEDKDDKEEEKRRTEENRKNLETAIDKIAPNKIDISSFKIANDSISINKTLEFVKANAKTTNATIPLFNTGRAVTLTGITGSELASLAQDAFREDSSSMKNILSLIYNHDISPDKPTSFTRWMKSIDYSDLTHLYFGLYKATFEGSNYISFTCPECKSFFMSNDIPMDKMWELNEDATEEDKKRLETIINNGTAEKDLESRKKLYALSNDYAVLLSPLTLYDSFEASYADKDFRQKYSGILNIAQFTKAAYYIDKAHGTLKPVNFEPDSKSIVRTLKKKILVMNKIIKSINSDQYMLLDLEIADIERESIRGINIFDYFIPEQPCLGSYKEGKFKGQKCNYVFEKQPMHPLNMLFTRRQLGLRGI